MFSILSTSLSLSLSLSLLLRSTDIDINTIVDDEDVEILVNQRREGRLTRITLAVA